MTYYSGVDGSLDFQGLPVAKVRDWQLSMNTDALEVTTLAAMDREFTTGLRSASGSCTVLYYNDAPVPLMEQVLQQGAQTSSIGRLKLKYGPKYFEFEAVFTGAGTGVVVGDVMQVAVQFQKSGPFIATAL